MHIFIISDWLIFPKMQENMAEKSPISTHSGIDRSQLQDRTFSAIEKTLLAFYDSDEEELTRSQWEALKLLEEVYGKLIHS